MLSRRKFLVSASAGGAAKRSGEFRRQRHAFARGEREKGVFD
jgi:hypothetical protein